MKQELKNSWISLKNLEKLYNYIINILNSPNNLSFKKIYKNDKVSDYVLIYEDLSKKFSLNFFIDDFYFERETS